jgi:hypothetical protein
LATSLARVPGELSVRTSAVAAPRFWILALALVGLYPGHAWAQAGPPYQTDDPDPVQYRHWELYLATQTEATNGDLSGAAPLVEVNYGAVPRLQLHVLVPLAFDHPAGLPAVHGAGDVEVGAKVQFVAEGRRRPMIGTFVQTEWPAGSASEGLGTGRLHVLIPLWIQKSFGPWSTDVGGGYWVNPGDGQRDYWVAGWQVGRRVGPATIGAELYHATADHVGGRSRLLVNAGVVLDLSDEHHLLLSVGHTVTGVGALDAYFAYQLTIGPG